MNKLSLLLAIILFSSFSHAVEMGIPIQLKLKSPAGEYPTESGLTFTVQVLSATGGCVLREETFAGQTITSGTISLALGTGTPGAKDAAPAIDLVDVYSNSAIKNGLTCVDANNNITGTSQSYNPGPTDTRVVRVMTTLAGPVSILADFIQRSTPYAIHAESVGGKVAADILVQNSGTSLNQANLEDIFGNATKFNKIKNIADNGVADSATTAVTATNATNFTANLVGDVTGTQSATVVAGIRGVVVAATAPVSGQVLGYNGSQYVPMTFVASAPVASVNGQLGSVVLTAADVGAMTSATAFAGDVTGNAAATVVSAVGGKSAASITATVNSVDAATALPTASTIARRDGSGNLVASAVLAGTASSQYVNIFDTATNTNYVQFKAPAAFANYVLTLPVDDGTNGQVLQTDGAGILSWTAPGTVTSASIATALGYTPADSALVALRSNNLSDLASATVARTNLGLGGAAVLNVGTIAGSVAAGDDARITGALSQTSFNTYVAGATCSSGQSMYWNSVSSLFACQNIALSGDVSGIASSVTVTKIQGVGASFSSIASNHILQYNGTDIINRAIPTCGASQYLTFNGSAWSCATDIGTAGIVSSVAVTSPLQTTGGNAPTLSMTQATGSVSGYLTGTDWTTFNNKITSSAASVAQVLGFSPANSATVVLKSNNLSDLLDVVTARANLGLGGFATVSSLDLGSASATGTLDTARLPAFAGDVTSTAGSNSLTVTQLQGVAVSATAPVAGQHMVFDGATWAPKTDPVTVVVKASDQSVNSTVTSVTSLVFNVTSGVTYKFKFNVLFQSGSTAVGAKFTVTVPAGTIAAAAHIPMAADGIDSIFLGQITSSGDVVMSTATLATATTYYGSVEGVFIATASGQLQLQIGAETGAANITVKAGSSGEMRALP